MKFYLFLLQIISLLLQVGALTRLEVGQSAATSFRGPLDKVVRVG